MNLTIFKLPWESSLAQLLGHILIHLKIVECIFVNYINLLLCQHFKYIANHTQAHKIV